MYLDFKMTCWVLTVEKLNFTSGRRKLFLCNDLNMTNCLPLSLCTYSESLFTYTFSPLLKLFVSNMPAVAINTHGNNLVTGINHVKDLNPEDRPPIPAWALPFIANYPIEYDAFLAAIMNIVQDVTRGGIVDNFCIVPNSLTEWGNINGRLTDLNCDQLVVTIANGAGGPLGRVHLFNDSQAAQFVKTFRTCSTSPTSIFCKYIFPFVFSFSIPVCLLNIIPLTDKLNNHCFCIVLPNQINLSILDRVI